MQLKCKGVFDIKLIGNRGNKVKDYRKGLSNLLLERWRTEVLETGDMLSGVSQCHAGDNGTPPLRTDTYVLGNVLGVSDSYILTESYFTVYPAWVRIEYFFEAGTATGTIRELAVGYTGNANSRIVIDPPIEKRETDKLIVTYTRYVYRPDAWTGVITGGQFDGTDVNWECAVNNRQLHNIFHDKYLDKWLLVRSTPYSAMNVVVGDSNLPSDLVNDLPVNNKGNILYSGMVDFYNAVEPTDSYKDITFGFETGTANGEIGEIILVNKVSSSSSKGLCRFTFDPKLPKSESNRLYLTWRWSIADW